MEIWEEQIAEFKAYLLLERGMSPNSIAAYIHDITRFVLHAKKKDLSMSEVTQLDIADFLQELYKEGKTNSSRARMTSGIRSFFDFLINRNVLEDSPLKLIETPSINRYLPTVLTQEEVEKLIESVDLSDPLGHRNKAILETLYSCGLRVSELTSLRLTDLFFEDGYIRVIGKGERERLIPVNDTMVSRVNLYLSIRRDGVIARGEGEYLFLNRRGKRLSRVMIYKIVQTHTAKAGIEKEVTPHTLRHTFATHLILGGADIRIVQDLLGHESILTTEIYTHLNNEYKHKTVEAFHPLARKKELL